MKIVDDIIDSYDSGLGIGNMTSQCFAIFYLNDLDHYIKEELKIEYYVRYQDDMLLFHPSKAYLQECFSKIIAFLKQEKLELNPKSRIYSNKDNFVFLGRKRNNKYANYKRIKGKLNKRYYLYKEGKLQFNSFVDSVNSFYSLDRDYTERCLKKISNTLL